jgi:hypothetical protein
MAQLSWQELKNILLEYEEKHNYDTLKTCAAKYHPPATRVEVVSFSEYDDSNYFQTYSVSSTTFYQEEEQLEPPRDNEVLARLISSSDALRVDFEEAKPSDPLTWFKEQYYGDFCDLDLYGPELVTQNVPTRLIAEHHIQVDLGFIPTVEKAFDTLPLEVWMYQGAQALTKNSGALFPK